MKLRPYQQEVARAVLESIQNGRGLTFSVEIARQGGKNELSAHLELLLLIMYMSAGGNAVKCSPTFKPQTIISMTRLKERLDEFGFGGIWFTEAGYMVRLGNARQIFLSAEESSSVVGHTADILLEIDECQDNPALRLVIPLKLSLQTRGQICHETVHACKWCNWKRCGCRRQCCQSGQGYEQPQRDNN